MNFPQEPLGPTQPTALRWRAWEFLKGLVAAIIAKLIAEILLQRD
jgi:hypothetical protein